MAIPWTLPRTAGLAALSLLGLTALGGTAALRRPLPRTSGRIALRGLAGPVEILRDRWGVPHIYASSDGDLFFAQGFVHAQDRLWQMDLNRRTGHGQLAEIFGPLALEADCFLRTLGFTAIAEAEVARSSEGAGLALERYADGVNACIERLRALPVEFQLLRYQPRPWRPADTLAWGKIMSLNLANNWTSELLRERIVAAVGPERAAALEPHYPDDQPLTLGVPFQRDSPLGAAALEQAAAASRFVGGADMPQGSNAWAVAGWRSSSGRPLLANDPHLVLGLPSLWYENHLESPGYQVAGASIPAIPGVIIGHTARVAWGVTNGMVDTQDLFVEQRHPDDQSLYRYDGQWERATVRHETISVKGRAAPHVEDVHVTRHGPVLRGVAAGESRPLALCWTALRPGRVQEAVLALNRAGDWASFRAAVAQWDTPPQNLVYADVDGHIGYLLGGEIPQRQQGDGRLPVPGWEAGHEWRGMVPTDELPQLLDPPEGLVVSANNRIAPDDFAHPLPGEWFSGYRAARIRELLDATARHSAETFSSVQGDLHSLPGLELAALVATLPLSDPLELAAQGLLAGWDGHLGAASVAASLYAATRHHLLQAALAEVAGPLATALGVGPLASLPGNNFLTRSLPGVLRRCREPGGAALVEQAFRAAVAELRSTHGDDLRRWRYGLLHRFTIRHPLGAVPALGRLLNRGPLFIGGDIDTVCMGNMPRERVGGPTCVAPSYRLACDTGDWDACRSVLPGGQSGHPGSRHYADQLALWRLGRGKPLLWSRDRVVAATEARLVLAAPNL